MKWKLFFLFAIAIVPLFLLQTPHFKSPELQEQYSTSCTLHSQIPSLQNSHYLKKKTNLLKQAEAALLLSRKTPKEDLPRICNPAREGRILSQSIGIFKTDRNCNREALVWELAVLLGCDRFIAPSLPLHIYEKSATFQPFFRVKHYNRFLKKNTPVKNISPTDFWTLSLFMFLVGHTDLNGDNIHHHKTQGLLLLDNDTSFPETNIPHLQNKNSLAIPLQNALLDLDLAYVPTTRQTHPQILSFLHRLQTSKSDLETYLSLSPLCKDLPPKVIDAFWDRFNRITQTPLPSSTTLFDFSRTAFPEHFKFAGELEFLLTEILGYPVAPSTALHLISSYFRYWTLEPHQKQRIEQWIASHFGPY